MLKVSFTRRLGGACVEIEEASVTKQIYLDSDTEVLRRQLSDYSINEVKDIHDQIKDWILAQESEFDIPIGYRDFHKRLGQIISDFVTDYLLTDEDSKDAGE